MTPQFSFPTWKPQLEQALFSMTSLALVLGVFLGPYESVQIFSVAYLVSHMISSIVRSSLIDSHYVDGKGIRADAVAFQSVIAATAVGVMAGTLSFSAGLVPQGVFIWSAVSFSTVTIVLMRALLIFNNRTSYLLLIEFGILCFFLFIFLTPSIRDNPFYIILLWWVCSIILMALALRVVGWRAVWEISWSRPHRALLTEAMLTTLGKQGAVLLATVFVAPQVVVIQRLGTSLLGIFMIGVQSAGQAGLAGALQLSEPPSRSALYRRLLGLNFLLYAFNVAAIGFFLPILSTFIPSFHEIDVTALWLAIFAFGPMAAISIISMALKSSKLSHKLLAMNMLDFFGHFIALGVAGIFQSINAYFIGIGVVGVFTILVGYKQLKPRKLGN